MPETYDSICRKKGFLAETLYQLEENPHPRTSWYEEANLNLHSTARGIFQLYYALKSFPKPTDDRRYILFFVTKQGIFTSTNSHSNLDEPIDFNTLRCRFFCYFERKMLITLKPNTREIIILKNYRYTVLRDGAGLPNSNDNVTDLSEEEKAKRLKILVESNNYHPMVLDYYDELYRELHAGHQYLCLRSDNYIDIDNVIFCRQPY